ncbi:chymotrypsin-2-like [Anopheles bellator]|uniref:chymotrypsin-2-like n=1 Tax=Anopheles bellator TaxID=139047 RepID=UPI0026483361|nr:chymotrypsin-2-like [Anopheles bellator]
MAHRKPLAVLLAAVWVVLLQTGEVRSIVGGHTSLPGDAPYVVAVRLASGGSYLLCSGVLVKANWVLTTARCVSERTEADLAVLAGSHRLLTNKALGTVSKVVRHPSYDATSGAHNLALLQLTTALSVSPVVLNDASVTTGAVTAFHGWGSLRYGTTSYSNELQTLYQRALSAVDCRAQIASLAEGDVCAMIQPGQAACSRDEGGPLVLYASKKLAGIFSYGTQCSGRVPDVFVDVYTHKAWIEATAV